MTNFIFKSQGTYKKLANQLSIIQSELRAQRQEHIEILFKLNKLVNDKNLQTQVDNYFEKDPFGSAFKETLDETPPEEASE